MKKKGGDKMNKGIISEKGLLYERDNIKEFYVDVANKDGMKRYTFVGQSMNDAIVAICSREKKKIEDIPILSIFDKKLNEEFKKGEDI